MRTQLQSYISAILADAAYALGESEQGDLTAVTGTRLESYLSERMTPALARYIGDQFTVVTHIETNDVYSSGFDATVWKEKASGKLIVSMQGTTREKWGSGLAFCQSAHFRVDFPMMVASLSLQGMKHRYPA